MPNHRRVRHSVVVPSRRRRRSALRRVFYSLILLAGCAGGRHARRVEKLMWIEQMQHTLQLLPPPQPQSQPDSDFGTGLEPQQRGQLAGELLVP